MKQMTQAQFMRKFNEEYREEFEPSLFQRDNEEIVKSIEKVLRSCERDKYFTLKLLDFTPIYNYEEIYNTLRDHEERRKKKNDRTENMYDFINIKDTDMILIKVHWLVRHNGMERQEIDGKSIEVINPEEIIEVLIGIPRFVRGYYFRLSGNYYTTNFQIIDGSTYNNSTSSQSKVDTTTFKTIFTPIRVFRGFRDLQDINSGEMINLIEYNSIIFNTSANIMFYLLANFGFYGCCEYLDIPCVAVSSEPVTKDDFVCFEKNGVYISCPKFCLQDPMVQSFCATIYAGLGKDGTLQDVFDTRYWLKVLGMAFKNASIDKGLFILDSIDGTYDLITHDDLHLPEEDKKDIYAIMRWVCREFSLLRVKENTDISTKRIRLSDYIAHLYATKLNKGMHRISDMGRRVTLKKVIQAVYTGPMFILNNLTTMSNLVSYCDFVNDGDATQALKYTYKGISGLGEDGGSVQPIYRHVDPSNVGVVDLDASTTSDPGMTGIICPMAKMYGHSFSEYEEPNEWRKNWEPIKKKYFKGTEIPITVDNPQPYDYMKERNRIIDEELEINRIECPIEDIENPDTMIYTLSGQKMEQINAAEKPKSLFTIVEDESNLSGLGY